MGFLFLLHSNGLILALTAVLLQIAVFLQPLLPQQYQIAPVCETITRALLTSTHSSTISHDQHAEHLSHSVAAHEHLHDDSHQCQYCTVYGNLILPVDLTIEPILDRIQVRFVAWQNSVAHVWFALQRLFLLPQGRAPPVFA